MYVSVHCTVQCTVHNVIVCVSACLRTFLDDLSVTQISGTVLLTKSKVQIIYGFIDWKAIIDFVKFLEKTETYPQQTDR